MATQKDMWLVKVSQEDTERSNYIYYVVDSNKVKNIAKDRNVKISGAITIALYGKGLAELPNMNDYDGSFHYYEDYDGSIHYYENDLLHRVFSFDSITKEELQVIEKFINISIPAT